MPCTKLQVLAAVALLTLAAPVVGCPEQANTGLLAAAEPALWPLIRQPVEPPQTAKAQTEKPAPSAPFVPAGLVKIPAGPVVVGVDVKAASKRIQEEKNPDNRAAIGGEVGRHTVNLEEFWISPTLVTNEMYLEFVTATGARPPAMWAVVPKELKETTIVENQKKDPKFKWDEEYQGIWWAKNWEDPAFRWEVPPAAALEPVVFITYEEALSYCAWAGVRLPTEAELIRAGRGDAEQDYPFGKEFKRELVSHVATLPTGLAFKRTPVAMLANASPFGVYDLVGNVWELTSSPFMPYEGFPSTGFKVKVKETVTDDKGKQKQVEKEITIMPPWDPARRVIKGGCFAVDAQFCRLDVRVGFNPQYASQAVGFRVVSSGRPAVDASLLRARNLRSNLLGGKPEEELDGNGLLGLERRAAADMSALIARRAAPPPPMKDPELPAGYQALGASEIISLIPRRDPFAEGDHPEMTVVDRDVRKSRDFPVLGVYVTSFPLKAPALPAGTYLLAWMPSYKAEQILALGALLPEKEMPESVPELKEEDKPTFDLTGLVLNDEHEHLLFIDMDGKAVGAVELQEDLKLQADRAGVVPMTLNLEHDVLDYRMRLPGRAGKTYSLRFRLKPVDADGKSLVREDWWLPGEYVVQKAPPGARSIVVPPALQPK